MIRELLRRLVGVALYLGLLPLAISFAAGRLAWAASGDLLQSLHRVLARLEAR